ncbi:unnamed protein product [Coffea canephora]|uniref:Pentacotripeptide-repeat region of PRORP domain-containing protein n=1 Tax=Coffea canephora TaxID=49390 RepID=A0A068TQD2_COFCA|nr:unnamed protein product [Coffea canephora]
MDKRGIPKDLHSYSIYMDIQCKSGKPWRAVKLFKEMKTKGVKLDVVAYNTLVRAIGISEGVDVALKLYREMIELGFLPNIVTYNTILKLLCENGRYKDAHKFFNEMLNKGCEPNVRTYNCFFGCLQKPGEILKWGFLRPVLLVWKKMEEHGVSPNEFAYNALIDILVQKGMVDMARKYDEEMMAKGLSAKPRVELGTKLISVGPEDG